MGKWERRNWWDTPALAYGARPFCKRPKIQNPFDLCQGRAGDVTKDTLNVGDSTSVLLAIGFHKS